jgi:hypothetical protein
MSLIGVADGRIGVENDRRTLADWTEGMGGTGMEVLPPRNDRAMGARGCFSRTAEVGA